MSEKTYSLDFNVEELKYLALITKQDVDTLNRSLDKKKIGYQEFEKMMELSIKDMRSAQKKLFKLFKSIK